MNLRLAVLVLCSLWAGSAQAAVLRISAEPPLSIERLADALRSYVEGFELEIAPPGHESTATPGVIEISLRRVGATDDEVELVLLDGEETILSRLPRAMRSEDLYRSAALKVHALLERRSSPPAPPADSLGVRETAEAVPPQKLMVDTGFAVLVPSAGPVREGLRLAAGLRLALRGHILLGAYIEPGRSSRVNGIDVSAWELPILLAAGYDWHQGAWSCWSDVVGHVAVRRVSAKSPDIDSNSEVALAPRVGGSTGLGFAIGQGLRLHAQVSLLATLADRRYRVDGQVVWPSARALGVIELGLVYGGP